MKHISSFEQMQSEMQLKQIISSLELILKTSSQSDQRIAGFKQLTNRICNVKLGQNSEVSLFTGEDKVHIEIAWMDLRRGCSVNEVKQYLIDNLSSTSLKGGLLKMFN